MNKYLRLFRFENGLMGAIGVLISCFIAAGYDVVDHTVNVCIACIVVIVFVAGGNSLNDYIDREIDGTAHPDRPLPSGEMAPKTALACGIGGLVAAIVLSILLPPQATVIVAICAVLMVSYETVLKQRGFVGNVCIALLTGMIFIFAGSVVGDYSRVWILAILAALVSVGREIAKDIEDKKSDEGTRSTLPMLMGDRNAAIIAALFFIIGPVLSFIPLLNGTFGVLYCTVLVADAIFIYCAATVFSDAHNAEKYAKVAMMAALASFILGVII